MISFLKPKQPGQGSAPIIKRDWLQLNAAAPGKRRTDVPITRLMHLVWLMRGDLQRTFPLDSEKGRLGFARWFILTGRREYGLGDWLVPEYDFGKLDASIDPQIQNSAPDAGSISAAIWSQRPDLQDAFPRNTRASRRAFLKWLSRYGAAEYRLSIRVLLEEYRSERAWTLYLALLCKTTILDLRGGGRRLARVLRGRKLGTQPDGPLSTPAGIDETRRPDPSEILPAKFETLTGRPLGPKELPPHGINLIGYARGELGLGEDVRTAASALATQSVPLGVINITRGLGARQNDRSADKWISEAPSYRASLFCVSAVEMFNVFLELGYNAFDGRYNIGYWPWELPRWPDECRPAFYFVDEVWASTQFAADSVATRAPVPVRRMPLAVTLPPPVNVDRARFGLPRDTYLFVFTFDFNSFIARKNPFGSIKAFQAAFPAGQDDAGLVIKVMNQNPDDPIWRKLQALADADPRITLITGTLGRDEVIGLVNACDSYLSLHRSEGFGRGPAEAMLLGKPVIATGYSGNTDFCTPETSFPVEYKLVPVGADEYLFPAGQEWADPSIEHAAAHMRALAADPAMGHRVGAAAQRHMETHHSPEAVGRAYAERLRELGLI